MGEGGYLNVERGGGRGGRGQIEKGQAEIGGCLSNKEGSILLTVYDLIQSYVPAS